MAKTDEISYVKTVSTVENVPVEDFKNYLRGKPFTDGECWRYLIDIGQILRQLPAAPARILDLGCGSGWTSEIFARAGYSVVGLDICDDLLELASEKKRSNLDLLFHRHDYEQRIPYGVFDAAVIFDALHHADEEENVIKRASEVLRPGGVFVILEPGYGHSTTLESLEVVRKYGTTEKDMPFRHFGPMLKKYGFNETAQYLRVTGMPMVDVSQPLGAFNQIQHCTGLTYETAFNGLTSLVVAKKVE